MKEWILLEQLKKEANDIYLKDNNASLYNISKEIFEELKKSNDLSGTEAVELNMGLFALIAEQDSDYSHGEHMAIREILHKEDFPYNVFCTLMEKFNTYEKVTYTCNLYKRITNANIMRKVLLFAVLSAICDGPMNNSEELYCASMCKYYIGRFQ